jgi:hypothetical protein
MPWPKKKGYRAVPTDSNAYLKILRKLVKLWRGTSTGTQAGEVADETPAKEQAQRGTSRGVPDRTHRGATKNEPGREGS